MKSSIKLKTEQLKELKKLHRLSDIDIAKRIGVTVPTLQRAMAGENVSAAFVAGATLYFRVPFETLFQTVQVEKVAA